MRLKYLAMIFAVLALSLTVVACSGDDDDDDGGGNGGQQTEAPAGNGDDDDAGDDDDGDDDDGNGGGNGGSGFGEGSATLTIGDETWEFDGIFCAFSPEESQNESVSFSLTSFGQSETGARTQLDATILDSQDQGRYEGDDVSHHISLDDVDDFENPSVSWSSLFDFLNSEPIIQIDGKSVTAETTFDDGRTDEIEEEPGSLVATCP